MILDTCALLWLANGGGKLSRATLKNINEAPAVYVSAVTGFEIGVKSARRALKLPLPARQWIEQVVEHHGLTVIPLDLEVCVAAAQLPPIHNDPCDRFIIATAKLNDLQVVTTDKRFAGYGIAVVS